MYIAQSLWVAITPFPCGCSTHTEAATQHHQLTSPNPVCELQQWITAEEDMDRRYFKIVLYSIYSI